MKYLVSVLLVCALVASTLAAKAHPAQQARKHNEKSGPAARKAEHHEVKSADVHAARATQGADLQSELRSALNKAVGLASDGTSLAVDMTRSFLTGQQSRAGGSLQKRAVKLADDTMRTAQEVIPTIARAIGEYGPSVVQSAKAIAKSLLN